MLDIYISLTGLYMLVTEHLIDILGITVLTIMFITIVKILRGGKNDR